MCLFSAVRQGFRGLRFWALGPSDSAKWFVLLVFVLGRFQGSRSVVQGFRAQGYRY